MKEDRIIGKEYKTNLEDYKEFYKAIIKRELLLTNEENLILENILRSIRKSKWNRFDINEKSFMLSETIRKIEPIFRNKDNYKKLIISYIMYLDSAYNLYLDFENLLNKWDIVMKEIESLQDELSKTNCLNAFIWECIQIGEEKHIAELLNREGIKPTKRIIHTMRGAFGILGTEYRVEVIKSIYKNSSNFSHMSEEKFIDTIKLLFKLERIERKNERCYEL